MKSWQSYPCLEPPVKEPREPLCTGSGPFRLNVAALILRAARGVENGGEGTEILLGERLDTPGCWQWPQGGLDPGEEPEGGLLREVREETGIEGLDILYRFPFLLRYRFPARFFDRFRPNIGQEQLYFIARLSAGEAPDLTRAETPEFRQLQWRPVATVSRDAVWFKRPVYHEVYRHTLEKLPGLSF